MKRHHLAAAGGLVLLLAFVLVIAFCGPGPGPKPRQPSSPVGQVTASPPVRPTLRPPQPIVTEPPTATPCVCAGDGKG